MILGIGFFLWVVSRAGKKKARGERKGMTVGEFARDVQLPRYIEILNDDLRLCKEGKTAKTKVGRAEDALYRTIPAIRRMDPSVVQNLDDLERVFESVLRSAEAVEYFAKARQAKSRKRRVQLLGACLERMKSRRTTDDDFDAVDAKDPVTGQMLSEEMIRSAFDEALAEGGKSRSKPRTKQ